MAWTFDNTNRALFRAQKGKRRTEWFCVLQAKPLKNFFHEKKNEMAFYNLKLKLLFKAGFPLIYR